MRMGSYFELGSIFIKFVENPSEDISLVMRRSDSRGDTLGIWSRKGGGFTYNPLSDPASESESKDLKELNFQFERFLKATDGIKV
jgi:hypothetical protein